jgi:hypothetical protein
MLRLWRLRIVPEYLRISGMKAWQIFLVGTIGAVALFSVHAYESALAGMAALAIVAAVIVGFCLRPCKEIFYLRTTVPLPEPDYAVVVEHNQIAVRVELARLWLLFIPTFAAVAFLLVTCASGITWKIGLLDDYSMLNWLNLGPYPILLFFRFLVIGVIGLLTAWMSERSVLRDASACNADSVYVYKKRIAYSFRDPHGEYYGGEGIRLGSTRSPQLRTVVLYRTGKPRLSKIEMCCLFHRLVIVGRGLTDLDKPTVATHRVETQPVCQPL